MKNHQKGFLGVVAGIVVFVAMTLLLGEISEDIINREPLTVADARLSVWLHVHTSPLLTSAMRVVTFFGSTLGVILIATAFGFYFVRRRRFDWLAALASAVLGGMLLNKILKFAFHRPRPFFTDPLLTLTSYSFPSGHTMNATVLYGAIAAYLFTTTRAWTQRALIIFSASLLVLLVAFSRMYLGAHYLSDVLGAMAEGLAWLTLCLTMVYSISLRRSV